jgi:hypothetical protein
LEVSWKDRVENEVQERGINSGILLCFRLPRLESSPRGHKAIGGHGMRRDMRLRAGAVGRGRSILGPLFRVDYVKSKVNALLAL